MRIISTTDRIVNKAATLVLAGFSIEILSRRQGDARPMIAYGFDDDSTRNAPIGPDEITAAG